VFFYVTVTVAAEHYSVVNAKAGQYEVGDIMYLDGVYTGLVFNSSRKFVIRKTTIDDNGREITLEMKSIEPISEFTSTAVGQNATEQDTIDSDDIMQDTIDSDMIHQDKI